MRLNKFLSHAGVCSRRKADEFIKQGRVKINSCVVKELGTKVDPFKDKIEVDGKLITPYIKFVYIALNKPTRVISSVFDPQGRRTVIDLVPKTFRNKAIVPVGRLDFMSEGLILLTNDKELIHKLTHPRHHIPKIYMVSVKGDVTEDKLDIMRKGMVLRDSTKLAPVKVKIKNRKGREFLLEMVLVQGINRQIRRMCHDLDLSILKLERISIGPISLGELKPGSYRHLSNREIKALKKIL